MKQICLFSIIASVIVSATSCSRDDMDTVSGETGYVGGYKSTEDVFAAVDSLYRTGAPAFYGECTASGVPAAMIGGYLSGFFNSESGTETGALWESCRDLTLDDANVSGFANSIWEQAYGAVRICNELIAAAPNTQWLTDDQRERVAAEACFFRAFNYFYLAKTFGAVPIVKLDDDNTATDGNLAVLYEYIVRDLESASGKGKLPNTAFTHSDFRITRPVALSLLADVYLTMSGWPLQQNRYEQAAQLAIQVIEGGKHSLLANGATPDLSAWNKLRTQNDNSEFIYSYRVGQTSRSLASFCLPQDATDWGVLRIDTDEAYTPTKELMNVYESQDTRSKEQQFFHSFVKYEKGSRTMIQTFTPKSYWWFDRAALFDTGTNSKDVVIYRYAEVLLIAAEAIAMSEGVTSQAAGYLADVRSRAYPNIGRETILSELMMLDRAQFIEEVWTERMREFPLEMKIWPDIQRTRKYPVISSGVDGNVSFRDVTGASNPFGKSFEEKHLLLPKP
jgi:hypothetical protein